LFVFNLITLPALPLPTKQTKKRLRELVQLDLLNEISQPPLRSVAYFMWLSADFPDCLPRRGEINGLWLCAQTSLFILSTTLLL